jgi:hexosaminidase
MGWNQILNNKLPSDAIAQYWMLDKKKVIKHLTRGRKIVMSKFGRVYLDYGYAFTPLRKTYAYEPVPKELKKQHHENILGVEATMWTEWVPNAKRLYWQLFPRLIAVAETGWTQKEKKDYNSFKMRLDMFLKRLEYLGINHALKEEIDPGFFKTLFGFLTIFKAPTGGT